jgi:hypothetical protein
MPVKVNFFNSTIENFTGYFLKKISSNLQEITETFTKHWQTCTFILEAKSDLVWNLLSLFISVEFSNSLCQGSVIITFKCMCSTPHNLWIWQGYKKKENRIVTYETPFFRGHPKYSTACRFINLIHTEGRILSFQNFSVYEIRTLSKIP